MKLRHTGWASVAMTSIVSVGLTLAVATTVRANGQDDAKRQRLAEIEQRLDAAAAAPRPSLTSQQWVEKLTAGGTLLPAPQQGPASWPTGLVTNFDVPADHFKVTNGYRVTWNGQHLLLAAGTRTGDAAMPPVIGVFNFDGTGGDRIISVPVDHVGVRFLSCADNDCALVDGQGQKLRFDLRNFTLS